MNFFKKQFLILSSFCIGMNGLSLQKLDCAYVNMAFLQEIDQALNHQSNKMDNGNYLATKADAPKLYAMVKKLTESFDIPMPRVYLYNGGDARALSLTQTNGEFEIGIDELRNLTSSQIETIIAHELAHLKKHHKLKGIAIASFLILANITASVLAFKRTSPISSRIVKSMLLFVALALIELPFLYAYKRAIEKEADLLSAQVTKKPQVLLSVYRKWHDQAVAQNKDELSDHPSFEEKEKYLGRDYLQFNL